MIGRFTIAPVRYAQSGVHGFGAFAAAPGCRSLTAPKSAPRPGNRLGMA